jgi:hypothetical protein
MDVERLAAKVVELEQSSRLRVRPSTKRYGAGAQIRNPSEVTTQTLQPDVPSANPILGVTGPYVVYAGVIL